MSTQMQKIADVIVNLELFKLSQNGDFSEYEGVSARGGGGSHLGGLANSVNRVVGPAAQGGSRVASEYRKGSVPPLKDDKEKD